MKLELKKTNSILVFFSLLAILIFSSCDKDDDKSPDLTPDKKCLISNFNVEYEFNDEVFEEISSLAYDENDRLSKIYQGDKHTEFIYDSNGKLERVESYDNDELDDTLSFSWEGNKVTRQRHDYMKDVIEFNSNNQIIRVNSYRKSENEWVKNWYNIYKWQNGNIVKRELYEDMSKNKYCEHRSVTSEYLFGIKNFPENKHINTQLLKSSNNDYSKITLKYRYDNKHNPFSMHEGFALNNVGYSTLALIFSLGIIGVDEVFHLSKNNVTEIIGLSEEKSEGVITYQYEYNDQNYPVKIFISAPNGEDKDNNEHELSTWRFNYKNCD